MRVRLLLTSLLFASPAFAKPPRLTLLISVDALGSDLYWRMKPRFRAGLLAISVQGATLWDVRGSLLGLVVWTGIGLVLAIRFFRFDRF